MPKAKAKTEEVTEQPKKTVAIVGFAGSSRNQINSKAQDGWEIWSLNNAYEFLEVKATRWFEIHGHESRQDYRVKHWEKLQELGLPIVALHPPANVPNVVELDYTAICERIGVAPYFTNSIAYMLAVAIDEGFEEIHLYGVDMATGSEYEGQRPCTEYWIGIARGAGIQVEIPSVSPLCRGSQYAVDHDEGVTRKLILDEFAGYREQKQNALAGWQKMEGKKEQLELTMKAIIDWEQENEQPVTREALDMILGAIHDELLPKVKESEVLYYTVDGAVQGARNIAKMMMLPDLSHPEVELANEMSPAKPMPEGMIPMQTNGASQEPVPIG